MPKLVRGATSVLFAAWFTGMLAPCVSALDLDPKVVSSNSVSNGPPVAVAISGNYAYVVTYEPGLHVIDISDPARPVEVGTYRTTGYGINVAVSGSYAYLATQRRPEGTNYVGGGLEIIDISNPANPQRMGSYSNHNLRAVAVSGTYAYVAEDAALRVIDISNPSTPQMLGSAASVYPWAVAISGSYAYVMQLNQGLQVFDVSDPLNPDPVGVYATNGYFQDVIVSGNYAYLADTVAGVHIVDVTQPTAPRLAGKYPSSAINLAIAGSYVYVAAQPRAVGTSNFAGGLHIVRVNDPANAQLVGRYDAIGALSVATSGHFAYLLDGSALVVIDVADPATPSVVGGYSVQRDARDVVLSGQYAYVADGIAGLEVFDVSDPVHPERVGGFFTGTAANSVAVAGNRAYLLGVGGLHILDIANPADPRRLGPYSLAADGRRVRISGNLAYVAAKSTNVVGGGLEVIDISNPANPQRLGGYSSSNAVDVAVAGNYAYLAIEPSRRGSVIDVPGALEVLDIRNPVNPQRVGRYATSEQTQGVAVSGAYAYVTDGTAGLQVLNIGNPANPQRVAVFPLTSYSDNFSIIGGYIGSAFTAVTVSSNRCFLAEVFLHFTHGIQFLGSSVQILDVSNVAPIRVGSVHIGEYDTPQYTYGAHRQGMAASATHLFVAGGGAGLQAVDIRRPASSQVVAHYNSTAKERGLTVAGNYAYIATQRYWTGSNWIGGGLQIIDVHDPGNPRMVAAPGGDDATEIAVSGTNAFVIAASTAMFIVDISDPANPKSVGRYDVGAVFAKVALAGNYACVVAKPYSGRGGLHVIDIRNRADPQPAGRYDSGGEAFDIAVSGNYAYMAQGIRWTGSNYSSGGLQVIDISNPMNPQRAGSYDISVSAHGVAVSGGYAYLVGDGIGLRVLDISNPANPRCIGTNDQIGATETVAVSGGYAYVMDSEGLMQVLDIRDVTHPNRVGGNSSFTAFFGGVPSSIAVAAGKVFLTTGSNGFYVLHRYQPIRFQELSRNNGMIRLQIAGPPGIPGRVERSSDLRSWADWLPVNFGEEPIAVVDSDANSKAFYRIAVP